MGPSLYLLYAEILKKSKNREAKSEGKPDLIFLSQIFPKDHIPNAPDVVTMHTGLKW